MDIKLLIKIFGSRMKSQEILLLLHNTKSVVRQGFYEHELPKIHKFCQQHNLYLVQSKLKILLDDEHNFTNKGLRIPETDPREGLYFIYLSKYEQQAYLASYYELINNHQELGKLLDYPLCCIDFFTKSFHEKNTNPQHPSTNPWTNLTSREQDYCLLSHFPCSSECQPSIEQAKKYYHTIQKHDENYAQELLQNLS